MKFTLKDRCILITGASSGLGLALAKDAFDRGAMLSLCARRTDFKKNFESERFLKIIKTDVADAQSVKNAVDETLKNFGKIDFVIANAGRSMWSRFADLKSPDELLDLMRLNYMGVVNTLFYTLPHLRKSRGAFLVISSIQGEIPVPYHSGYAASKYALNGFIESIAMEEPEVHFLLAIPGHISGTELRKQALKGSRAGSIVVNPIHKKAINAKDAAEMILNALERGKKYCYLPKHLFIIPILRKFFKKVIDDMTKKRVAKELL